MNKMTTKFRRAWMIWARGKSQWEKDRFFRRLRRCTKDSIELGKSLDIAALRANAMGPIYNRTYKKIKPDLVKIGGYM